MQLQNFSCAMAHGTAGGHMMLRLTVTGKSGEKQNVHNVKSIAGVQMQHTCKKCTESSLCEVQVWIDQYMMAHPIAVATGQLQTAFEAVFFTAAKLTVGMQSTCDFDRVARREGSRLDFGRG